MGHSIKSLTLDEGKLVAEVECTSQEGGLCRATFIGGDLPQGQFCLVAQHLKSNLLEHYEGGPAPLSLGEIVWRNVGKQVSCHCDFEEVFYWEYADPKV